MANNVGYLDSAENDNTDTQDEDKQFTTDEVPDPRNMPRVVVRAVASTSQARQTLVKRYLPT